MQPTYSLHNQHLYPKKHTKYYEFTAAEWQTLEDIAHRANHWEQWRHGRTGSVNLLLTHFNLHPEPILQTLPPAGLDRREKRTVYLDDEPLEILQEVCRRQGCAEVAFIRRLIAWHRMAMDDVMDHSGMPGSDLCFRQTTVNPWYSAEEKRREENRKRREADRIAYARACKATGMTAKQIVEELRIFDDNPDVDFPVERVSEPLIQPTDKPYRSPDYRPPPTLLDRFDNFSERYWWLVLAACGSIALYAWWVR